MKIDSNGKVVVDSVKPLNDLGEFFDKDFDEVDAAFYEAAQRGDDDEEMAHMFNY